MGYEPADAWQEEAQSRYDEEVGTHYLNEFGHELLYPEHYEEAVKEFTSDRLKSYYVNHPDLAEPAHRSLTYAQSLMPAHSEAALVFATTAVELAIKVVLLKPIVFGLVHTEGFATFITELTTQHTGMERFQALLAEILSQFGGVDLKTLNRANSAKTVWQEIGEIQTARNKVIHRGEAVDDATAILAVSLASVLLHDVFPRVLQKLELPFHEPKILCKQIDSKQD